MTPRHDYNDGSKNDTNDVQIAMSFETIKSVVKFELLLLSKAVNCCVV